MAVGRVFMRFAVYSRSFSAFCGFASLSSPGTTSPDFRNVSAIFYFTFYLASSHSFPSMIIFQQNHPFLVGSAGSLLVPDQDEITLKLAMLFEGQCEGSGPSKAAAKFGYTKQRYFQLLHQFRIQGASGLLRKRTGPKGHFRRTDEIVRQIIRHRFLDPEASAEVIAQKLRQTQHLLSIRSVHRVIADFGLQKKTLRP